MDPKRETKKEKDKTNGTNNESAQKKPKQKISLTKIKKLYKDDLELPRKQSLSDRIQLPFSLKKVMVDEWEIISQTDKVPNLPTTISIKSVLDQYLESKLQLLNSTTTIIIMDKSNEKETKSGGESKNQNTIVDDNPNLRASRKAQKRQEFYDMVEGITTYFDHMLPKHLLYRQEIAQYETIQKKPRFKYLRKCEIYGCEYLLRLFVRLPSLYEQKQQQEEEEEQKNNKLENQTKTINDNELRKVYAMIGDLVRYLQKHQYLFFKQTYRKPKDDEVMPMELHEVQVSTLDNDENRRTKKLKTTHSNNSNNKSKVSDRREKLTSTKDRKSAVRRKSKSVKHKVTGRNTTITKTNK